MKNSFLSDDITSKIPLTSLPGVGVARSTALARLGLFYVADVIAFFPARYEDRRRVSRVCDLAEGMVTCVKGVVASVSSRFVPSLGRRLLIEAELSDETGEVSLVFFNRFLDKKLEDGARVMIYGTVSSRQGRLQFASPEIIFLTEEGEAAQIADFARLMPVYPLTEGLKQSYMRKLARDVTTKYLHLVKEYLSEEILSRRSLLPRAVALAEIHAPSDEEKLTQARYRLKYEECYLRFLLGERLKATSEQAPFCKIRRTDKDLLPGLGFELTRDQKKAIEEITADMERCHMSRLLQGDVGSGKTLVAMAVANAVVGSGFQVAYLAPTEVLAEQIFSVAQKYVGSVAIITGKTRSSERSKIEEALASGEVNFVVGTHALFSLVDKFKNLALLVIDEQQRFGVNQRKTLLAHTPAPHLLMMTATPIPRTLTQVLYSDMSLSILRQKPAFTASGDKRQEIVTRIVPTSDVQKVLMFLGSEIKSGGRVYWVCPRVEESEASDLPAVEKRYEWLCKMLPMFTVGLIHGQMTGEEKSRAMESFKSGECQILAGTTVLEVGLDVAEASVIVIESPNRYGLSQLHQLRGRVGRGSRRGVCVLLVRQEERCHRLDFFASTNDGFLVAEEDLANRGSGDTLGTAQHGFGVFVMADPLDDAEIVAMAKQDAEGARR